MMRIPIESDARPKVEGEMKKKADDEKPMTSTDTAKEKVGTQMRERDFTAVDIALRRMIIEASPNHALSEAEARALAKKMNEKAGEFVFTDGVFMDEMEKAEQSFVDTERRVKITTVSGKEAVFKIMLTDKGEFKLRGDVLDPKGQYAEELLN